jgi:hypothetical protein
MRYFSVHYEPDKVTTAYWTVGVWLPAGTGNFLIATMSRPALSLVQPPIQSVPVSLIPNRD